MANIQIKTTLITQTQTYLAQLKLKEIQTFRLCKVWIPNYMQKHVRCLGIINHPYAIVLEGMLIKSTIEIELYWDFLLR